MRRHIAMHLVVLLSMPACTTGSTGNHLAEGPAWKDD
jgi:hypothetical protein